MVELDREQKKKWQKIGVVVAECIMVVSVVAIVILTTAISLGYNVNRDGEIEQMGLLQLHSIPTGATVQIDGEEMFARTNMSRSLSPGSHELKLTKEGYDAWEKNINITSGWLKRVYYPRLFWQERQEVKMAELGTEVEFYSAAPNYKYLLWAEDNATTWQWADITGDGMSVNEVDVSGVLGVNTEEFTGEVRQLKWSKSGERVLAQILWPATDGNEAEGDTQTSERISWYLVNLREPSKSQDLTANYGLDLSDVQIMDGAADKVWVLEGGNLRLINTASNEVSRVLVSGVESYAVRETAVAYVGRPDDTGKRPIGVYHEGEQGGVKIRNVTNDPTYVWLSRYYDEDYLVVAAGQWLTTYKGNLPSYSEDEKIKIKDYLTKLTEVNLNMTPSGLIGGNGDEYVLARRDSQVAVLDLDQGDVYQYEVDGGMRWLDDSMFYSVDSNEDKGGELTVWDYDGTNQRQIVDGVTDYDVVIAENNKYIYYIKPGDKLQLVRERIIK